MSFYSNILLYGGLAILVTFFILFSRNIKMLTSDELATYKRSASRRNVYITIALFATLYYFKNLNIQLVIAFLIIINMTLEGWLQKQKLIRMQFNPRFIKSTSRTELLSYVAVTMILAELIINTKA